MCVYVYMRVFQYSWYFFEALVKSMAQHLIESGKVKVSGIVTRLPLLIANRYR